MPRGFDEIIRFRLEIVKLAEDWEKWVKRIADASRRVLGESEVYVFGSIVEGRATGGSDVDILIVSSNVPEKVGARSRVKAVIEEEAGLPLYHPFQIHLATPREAEWYRRHMKRYVRVE